MRGGRGISEADGNGQKQSWGGGRVGWCVCRQEVHVSTGKERSPGLTTVLTAHSSQTQHKPLLDCDHDAFIRQVIALH